MATNVCDEASGCEDEHEENEDFEGERLYKLWVPFIGTDKQGNAQRDVEGVFFARHADYTHALGHDISLGELHGRFDDVTVVLTEDVCWEVQVKSTSLPDIRKIAPCGVNPVASFLEQLRKDCFVCCMCRQCTAYYNAKYPYP